MFKIESNPQNRKIFVKINNMDANSKKGIRKAFYYIGKDLRTAAKGLIDEPKHGRTYLIRRGKRTNRHTASAPGEAPAKITGNLKRSIGFDVSGSSKLTFGARSSESKRMASSSIVGGFSESFAKSTGVDYAKYLELGTRKMRPRPFLITSIKKEERNTRLHLSREIKKAIRK